MPGGIHPAGQATGPWPDWAVPACPGEEMGGPGQGWWCAPACAGSGASRGALLGGGGTPPEGFAGRAGKPEGTAWGDPLEACQGVGGGPVGDPSSPAHLANTIDAEVAAGLVAGGAVHHGVPQLLSKGLIRGPAVQLTGALWGPKCRSREDNRGRGPISHQEDRLHDTHQQQARASVGQPGLGPAWEAGWTGPQVPTPVSLGDRTHRH